MLPGKRKGNIFPVVTGMAPKRKTASAKGKNEPTSKKRKNEDEATSASQASSSKKSKTQSQSYPKEIDPATNKEMVSLQCISSQSVDYLCVCVCLCVCLSVPLLRLISHLLWVRF